MTLLAIVPLILIFGIMIVLVLVSKKVTFFKNTNLVLMIYVAVLAVFTAAYFIVPKSYTELDMVRYDREFNKLPSEVSAKIESGKLDEVKEYMIDEQYYQYDGKELIIENATGMEDWLNIVIEIKDESDGKIEVTQFHTGAYVNDMDISGYIKPVKLQMNEGQMVLQNPEPTYLNLNSFKKEFPMVQFNKNEEYFGGYSISSEVGSKVLYIQVPKGLLVKNETGFNFQYVEK